MKLLLPAALLFSLSACKKDTGSPAPLSPTGSTWGLISSSLTYTGNGSSTTTSKTVVPNTITLAFSNDGALKLMQDKSLTGGGSSYFKNGTYTLTNGVITTSYRAGSYNGTDYTETSTVFTNNSLTLVHTEQGANSSAVTTDTYTR